MYERIEYVLKKMNLEGAPESSTQKGTGANIMGIDLGTTNSAVSIFNAGTVPSLLPIGEGMSHTVPSCVRWDGWNDENEPIFTVGAEAYKERYKSNVVYSVKRIMGSGKTITLIDPNDQSVDDPRRITLTPAEVSAIILNHLAQRVEVLDHKITKCVITVPAYFNQRQINDTMEASRLAGLECLQILKEPTSASYIYSLLGYAQSGSVLIYDLGGGTFDVTHMNFLRRDSIPKSLLSSLQKQYGIKLSDIKGADSNDQYFCRVLGTYGDVNLGGDDIDKLAGDAIIARAGLTDKLTSEQKEEVYLRCEAFKKSGFAGEEFTIGGNTINLMYGDIDEAVDQIFDRTLKLMSDIDMSDVKTIVLVGGSTKSKHLRDNLAKAFPGVTISAVLDPDATVALGAGSVAKALASDKNVMYADVLPLPIGILVDQDHVEFCIAKNTPMPYVTSSTYYTMHDNQDTVTLHVYQGLSSKPEEDVYLGKLSIKGIPNAPAGEVSVGVGFMLTGQGRLKVTSVINGVRRDESLVIDNIFDVKDAGQSGALATKGYEVEGYTLYPEDDFEECFLPMAVENLKVLSLFAKRRTAINSGSTEVASLEDAIVAKLTGGGA